MLYNFKNYIFCEAGRCKIKISIQVITCYNIFSQQGNSNDIYLHTSRLELIQLHVAIHINRMLLGVMLWTLHPVGFSPIEIKLILTEFSLLERSGKCARAYMQVIQYAATCIHFECILWKNKSQQVIYGNTLTLPFCVEKSSRDLM